MPAPFSVYPHSRGVLPRLHSPLPGLVQLPFYLSSSLHLVPFAPHSTLQPERCTTYPSYFFLKPSPSSTDHKELQAWRACSFPYSPWSSHWALLFHTSYNFPCSKACVITLPSCLRLTCWGTCSDHTPLNGASVPSHVLSTLQFRCISSALIS